MSEPLYIAKLYIEIIRKIESLYCSFTVSSKINTSSFYVFMPHKVSKQSKVVETNGQGSSLRNGDGMNEDKLPPYSFRIFPQNVSVVGLYTTCRNTLPKPVQEYIACSKPFFFKPLRSFCPQVLRNIQTAYFSTFAIKVEVSDIYMLRFDME